MYPGLAPRVTFTPTPEHKRQALQSVRFEIEQVLSLLSRLHATPASDATLRHALLDRLVVHLRAILAFLELPERTVRYQGGRRLENDDVLASDYDFPIVRLSITDSERRELRRTRIALSYSREDATGRIPGALLSLTVPVLRRCAAFVDHLLSTESFQLEAAETGEWVRVRDTLKILAGGTQAEPVT